MQDARFLHVVDFTTETVDLDSCEMTSIRAVCAVHWGLGQLAEEGVVRGRGLWMGLMYPGVHNLVLQLEHKEDIARVGEFLEGVLMSQRPGHWGQLQVTLTIMISAPAPDPAPESDQVLLVVRSGVQLPPVHMDVRVANVSVAKRVRTVPWTAVVCHLPDRAHGPPCWKTIHHHAVATCARNERVRALHVDCGTLEGPVQGMATLAVQTRELFPNLTHVILEYDAVTRSAQYAELFLKALGTRLHMFIILCPHYRIRPGVADDSDTIFLRHFRLPFVLQVGAAQTPDTGGWFCYLEKHCIRDVHPLICVQEE
jgi:hypothetical protein